MERPKRGSGESQAGGDVITATTRTDGPCRGCGATEGKACVHDCPEFLPCNGPHDKPCADPFCRHRMKPDDIDTRPIRKPVERNPAPATALRIERYVRAQVRIGWLGNPHVGTIELGLHYERGERPSAFRDKLIEVAQCGFGAVFAEVKRADEARWPRGTPLDSMALLDEDTADVLTEDIDGRIVGLWGDRPRFLEMWGGASDTDPLTQVYAPHGMPRWR